MRARFTIQFTEADLTDLPVGEPIEITIKLGALSDRLKTLDTSGHFLHCFDAARREMEDEPQAGLKTVFCQRFSGCGSKVDLDVGVLSGGCARERTLPSLCRPT